MPIYEYKCETCNDVVERIFSIVNFPREVVCPSCGNASHKIISRTTFRLEGGGWADSGYQTNMEKFKGNMKAVDSY